MSGGFTPQVEDVSLLGQKKNGICIGKAVLPERAPPTNEIQKGGGTSSQRTWERRKDTWAEICKKSSVYPGIRKKIGTGEIKVFSGSQSDLTANKRRCGKIGHQKFSCAYMPISTAKDEKNREKEEKHQLYAAGFDGESKQRQLPGGVRKKSGGLCFEKGEKTTGRVRTTLV